MTGHTRKNSHPFIGIIGFLPVVVMLTGCTQSTGIMLTAVIIVIESFFILYLIAIRSRKQELKTALRDLVSFGHAEPTGIEDIDDAISGMEQALVLMKQELQESKDIQNEILIAQGRFKLAHRLMRAGMFSASVAHDLRGPLSGIIGSASLLHDLPERSGELVEKHTTNILRQAETCRLVIDNLLQQTRTEATDKKVCNISLTAKNAINECVNASNRDSTPDIDIPEDLFSMVDCTQIWQVVQNLVMNAFDATKKDGNVWIRLSTESGKVLFSVDDDGPGINEADVSRIFDPLYTGKKSGTGLGLVIVKMYVEANQGTIEVSRSEHGGARFVVALPEHRPDTE